jgi:hypothetical protein
MSNQFPTMHILRQKFPRTKVADISSEVLRETVGKLPGDMTGKKIAVTAGSRGIHRINVIVRSVVEALKQKGAHPFIIPAMGSHGGATAEGQAGVLETLGITESYCGAPIRSSMETVEIGTTSCGVPVYMDRYAYESDGVVLINRIKTHTDFKSDIESGLMKMAAIGLGKHAQALALHTQGIHGIRDVMKRVSNVVLESGKIVLGVGVVENAYDETALIEAILPADIYAREAELLNISKQMMPSLPVGEIDLLIVDEVGKNYSGTGMDTNIIGRMSILNEREPEAPNVKYIFARSLSEATHGNALGIGLADLTTKKVLKQIDFRVTNENVITSSFLSRGKIPMVLDNDKAAIEAALRANWGVDRSQARIVRISNTLELEHLMVSESLLDEVRGKQHVEILGPASMTFDMSGNLLPEEIGPYDKSI